MAEGDPKKAGVSWIEVAQAVAMPLVTLIVGYFFNDALNKREMRDNNVRLYADMMGRREEADSGLRKDMFKSILDTFLKQDPKQFRHDLEAEVLNIELLAYNFHESLDLGPLFKHVQRDLVSNRVRTDPNLLWRLERVAAGVKERQLAVLADSGMVQEGEFDLRDKTLGASEFGKATLLLKAGERRGGVALCLSIGAADSLADQGKHYRQFKIVFVDFARDRRELELSLAVSKPLLEKDCTHILDPSVEQANTEARAKFWVGLFGFPMIDNTHLSHSERCSVSVTDISADSARVAIAYFQASRASLKDKPYYDEVLHDLLQKPGASEAKEH